LEERRVPFMAIRSRGIRVHGDTHRVLKFLKEQRRNSSLDEVIRELVRAATGRSIDSYESELRNKNANITSFLDRGE
jgi:hypothetical protein